MLAKSARVYLIQFEGEKSRLLPDPFKDQASECARARPELDHGFGILQIAAAEHRLRERRRTGHECSDAGRFPQKGAEELQPFRHGRIELVQKADGGCAGAVTARPRPACIKIVHAFRRANPRQDIFRWPLWTSLVCPASRSGS